MALKSPQHVEREQAADRRRAQLWVRFAGGRTAAKLSNREWDRFVVERTSGAIDARGRVITEGDRRPVQEATARADLLWLRWVLN